MKLSVIALDYDGTVARGDVLDPSVRDAIAVARTQGIVVLLVTGRILDELRRVAGDLHFVDGVIAENGAVIHFPDSGRTSALAPLVPEAFVAELRRRRNSFRRRTVPGRRGCERGTAAAGGHPHARIATRPHLQPRARDDRRRKASARRPGCTWHSRRLRLSARNTVAIGDAENDHELLRLAEVGVAVEWGSKALAGGRRRRARLAAGRRPSPTMCESSRRPGICRFHRAGAVVCCSDTWKTAVSSRSRFAAGTSW